MPCETQILKPTATRPTPRRGFVLVVDDEEQNRTLLRDPLEARGYEVEEAENGLEALQKIAARPPDLDVISAGIAGRVFLRLRFRTTLEPSHRDEAEDSSGPGITYPEVRTIRAF